MTPETHSRTIVVGYDGSRSALAAVKHAIDRVGQDGRLVVVHAYLTPTDHIGASSTPRWWRTPRSSPRTSSTASSRTASASPRSSTRATWPSGPPPPRSSEPPRHYRGRPRSSSAAAASVACARCWGASPRRHPPRALSRHRHPRAHGGRWTAAPAAEASARLSTDPEGPGSRARERRLLLHRRAQSWTTLSIAGSEERRGARRVEPPPDAEAAGDHEPAEAALGVHFAAAGDVVEGLAAGVAPAERTHRLQPPLPVDPRPRLGLLGREVEAPHDLVLALSPPRDAAPGEHRGRREHDTLQRGATGRGPGRVRVLRMEDGQAAEQPALGAPGAVRIAVKDLQWRRPVPSRCAPATRTSGRRPSARR